VTATKCHQLSAPINKCLRTIEFIQILSRSHECPWPGAGYSGRGFYTWGKCKLIRHFPEQPAFLNEPNLCDARTIRLYLDAPTAIRFAQSPCSHEIICPMWADLDRRGSYHRAHWEAVSTTARIACLPQGFLWARQRGYYQIRSLCSRSSLLKPHNPSALFMDMTMSSGSGHIPTTNASSGSSSVRNWLSRSPVCIK
jgi:hypothetical protein